MQVTAAAQQLAQAAKLSDSRVQWLRQYLPDFMFDEPFLLMNWQWAAILAAIFVGFLLDFVARFLCVRITRRLLNRGGIDMDPRKLRAIFRPVGLLAAALFWMAVLPSIGLPHNAFNILHVAVTFLAASAGVWGAYRGVEIGTQYLTAKASQTESRYDDLLVPLVSKTAKVFIVAFGIVFVASNLDVNISSLLAGLGLGGLAFALAAKDTVSNLFGTLTIVLDRPFQVGDWVIIGSTEGSVERVGFRSTRLRTFYNSLITIPNGNLLTANVDNMGHRTYRRYKADLSLTYDTPPEKIDAFCEGVRELIRIHPYTRKDYYHVYLNSFAASSLDVLLYVFFEAPDWATELRERHRLIMDIIRLARELGVDFAFPTQTVVLERGDDSEAAHEEIDHSTEARQARLGRNAARALVEASMGELGKVPPPVKLNVSAQENRGESGE